MTFLLHIFWRESPTLGLAWLAEVLTSPSCINNYACRGNGWIQRSSEGLVGKRNVTKYKAEYVKHLTSLVGFQAIWKRTRACSVKHAGSQFFLREPGYEASPYVLLVPACTCSGALVDGRCATWYVFQLEVLWAWSPSDWFPGLLHHIPHVCCDDDIRTAGALPVPCGVWSTAKVSSKCEGVIGFRQALK